MPKKSTMLSERPPVIVVMGHVDHGKSALLDYIRKSSVVENEAGGITQQVSAYEVLHSHEGAEKRITFLDTPGHEAFGKIRTRGASVADIAILVVSAEEGVREQTLEALSAITDADIPYIVAINKIDKPEADVQKTKNSLVEHGIYIEGMGGSIPVVPISAKSGEGIDALLDMMLLVAELEELTGDSTLPAEGIVIESHRDPKKGIAATLIIKNGTLSRGEFVCAGGSVSPVRILENHNGETISTATFSSPIKIIGFNTLPEVGTEFKACVTKKEAESAALTHTSVTTTEGYDADDHRFVLPLILKADAAGSLEAIQYELDKLENDRAVIRIIKSGIGPITEDDVNSVLAGDTAVLVGFNVPIDNTAQDAARQHGITIETFTIIYKLTEWLTDLVKTQTPTREVEKEAGLIKVLKHFSRVRQTDTVGARVQSGVLRTGAHVHITRNDEIIGDGIVTTLQTQKQNVDHVDADTEFGAQIESPVTLMSGDILTAFEIITE